MILYFFIKQEIIHYFYLTLYRFYYKEKLFPLLLTAIF